MALIPPGKTPISFLQEISTKRGITPQYDLLANEGAVHEPVFIMRVTVGDVIATGKGREERKLCVWGWGGGVKVWNKTSPFLENVHVNNALKELNCLRN